MPSRDQLGSGVGSTPDSNPAVRDDVDPLLRQADVLRDLRPGRMVRDDTVGTAGRGKTSERQRAGW